MIAFGFPPIKSPSVTPAMTKFARLFVLRRAAVTKNAASDFIGCFFI